METPLDPTGQASLVNRDDFGSRGSLPQVPLLYSSMDQLVVATRFHHQSITDNLSATYISKPQQYLDLQDRKSKISQFNPNQYRHARDVTNPYERLGRSIFMNRAGVKLANIDALYKLTQHQGGLVNLTTPGQFKFCDLAGGPGAFSQYIQWRRPEAMGYGITLKGNNPGIPDWNLDLLDQHRFLSYYGDNGTGNLYTEWNSFVRRVRLDQVLGVDLVTADGGFDVEAEQAFSRQEILSSRLILIQLLTGLKLLRPGGDFVIKMFDTVTEMTAQIIFIASLCFDAITLFKPISSRPANAEKYLVCKGKRDQTDRYELILQQANDIYTETEMVTNLLQDPLPEEFTTWLTRSNDILLQYQRQAVDAIFDYLNGKKIDIPVCNLHQVELMFNLPGPQIPSRSKLRIPGSGTNAISTSDGKVYRHNE